MLFFYDLCFFYICFMTKTIVQKNSIAAAQQHILTLFNDPNTRILPYSNYRTAALWAQNVLTLGANEPNCSPQAITTATVAAWFGTIGSATNAVQSHEQALTLLEQFLYEHATNDTVWILQTLRCLQDFQLQKTPETTESRLLHDAWAGVLVGQNGTDWQKNQFAENELLAQNVQTWSQYQQQLLGEWSTFRCYTAEGKIQYEPMIQSLVDGLRAQIVGNKKAQNIENQNDNALPFAKAGKGNLRNAVQTYFRVTFANHIHLSQIADNKAHMLISINSVLVSLVVSVLTYKNLAQTTPAVLLPVSIFVLSSLASLSLAVWSVRPRITDTFRQLPESEQRKAIAFFGNFTQLDLATFETWTDELLSSRSLLHRSLTHDLYHLGKVLARKYRLLQMSYQVFLIGFVAFVLMLLVALYFW
jgi:hypothetical protein